jgi:glutamate synthase domain-containing protein 3
LDLAEEKVQATSKEINRALRTLAKTRKSVNIDRIKNNDFIAVGMDKPVKIRIDKGPAGDFLGALNAGSNIVLNGKAGRFVATTMSSGEVLVNGDAGEGVATYLSGGLVTIKGDCSGSVCGGMKGGVVIIDGNVTGDVGTAMEGGEIYVTGDISGNVGLGMIGGTVFVAGKTADLPDGVKVKTVGVKELEAIKDYHRRFKFKRFQSMDALKEFRMIGTV